MQQAQPTLAIPSPGTILGTLPGVNGPAVACVVQTDGSVLWVPLTGGPQAPPATQEAPAASPRRHRGRGTHRGA